MSICTIITSYEIEFKKSGWIPPIFLKEINAWSGAVIPYQKHKFLSYANLHPTPPRTGLAA